MARCPTEKYELIFDLLQIMERQSHLTLKKVTEYANMSWDTAYRPLSAIKKADLALISNGTRPRVQPIDSAIITQRGLQYLATFRNLQHLLRSGISHGCGKDVETPVKEWDLKTHVSQYECCGKKFREHVKRV